MAKKGPLGKAEAFYVEEKFKAGETVDSIAQSLDRSMSSIEEHIEKSNIQPQRTVIDQQFARQSGATVMTENASSMIDANRQKPKNINQSCVSKIK